MTNTKAKLRQGDLARVICADDSLGETLWLVEWIGERGSCVIREAGNPLAGGQDFDISLLQKVERDVKPLPPELIKEYLATADEV